MHFVFGSITTAFAKAQYAQDALGAQEKGQSEWKTGSGDWDGEHNEAKWKAGKRPCKVKQEWDKNTSAFFWC